MLDVGLGGELGEGSDDISFGGGFGFKGVNDFHAQVVFRYLGFFCFFCVFVGIVSCFPVLVGVGGGRFSTYVGNVCCFYQWLWHVRVFYNCGVFTGHIHSRSGNRYYYDSRWEFQGGFAVGWFFSLRS